MSERDGNLLAGCSFCDVRRLTYQCSTDVSNRYTNVRQSLGRFKAKRDLLVDWYVV